MPPIKPPQLLDFLGTRNYNPAHTALPPYPFRGIITRDMSGERAQEAGPLSPRFYTDDRHQLAGIPTSHAVEISKLARDSKCVILSRAIGPTCLQLLELGYDTKGFRIHGKSCDWGPMAGFVMYDPRLNKAGKAKEDFNTKQHTRALFDTTHATDDGFYVGADWRSHATPLKLHPKRVQWLFKHQKKLKMTMEPGGQFEGKTFFKGTAEYPGGPEAAAGGGAEGDIIRFNYVLIPENINGLDVAGVYFDYTGTDPETSFRQTNLIKEIEGERLEAARAAGAGEEENSKMHTTNGENYQAMYAMTNPPGHRTHRDAHFLNAVTGDYDLFGIWPITQEKFDKQQPRQARQSNLQQRNRRLQDQLRLELLRGWEVVPYDHLAVDRRIFGTAHAIEDGEYYDRWENYFVIAPNSPAQGGPARGHLQSTKMGNLTPRIYELSQRLNSTIAEVTNRYTRRPEIWGKAFPARNVFWHSDEAARPGVGDVDLPFIAYLPDGSEAITTTIEEFKQLISHCIKEGYYVTLADGWAKEPEEGKPRLGEEYRYMIPMWERTRTNEPIRTPLEYWANS